MADPTLVKSDYYDECAVCWTSNLSHPISDPDKVKEIVKDIPYLKVFDNSGQYRLVTVGWLDELDSFVKVLEDVVKTIGDRVTWSVLCFKIEEDLYYPVPTETVRILVSNTGSPTIVETL